MTAARRLLGLDPGLRATGWGVVDAAGSRLSHVASGTVRSDAGLPLELRLAALHDGLMQVIGAHAPDAAAVESVFVNRDGQATLKLGQARGVVLLAAARAGLPVAEYAPNHVKKSVVGAGHADKAQVLAMVRMLLPGCAPDSEHAADALAVAITHAHSGGAGGVAGGTHEPGGLRAAFAAGRVRVQAGPGQRGRGR